MGAFLMQGRGSNKATPERVTAFVRSEWRKSGLLAKEFDPWFAGRKGLPESRVRNLRQGRCKTLAAWEAERLLGDEDARKRIHTVLLTIRAQLERIERRI